MIVQPTGIGDFERIAVQCDQAHELIHHEPERIVEILSESEAITVSDNTNRILTIAGIAVRDDDAIVWALLSNHASNHLHALHRMAIRVMDNYHRDRLFSTTLEGFRQAERWLSMLGFAKTGGTHNLGDSVYNEWVRVR